MSSQIFPFAGIRTNFYDCLKSVNVMSKVLGLMPFTIHFHQNGRIDRTSTGVFDVIWFFCSITINTLLAYFVQNSSRSTANSESTVAHLSDRIVWFSELLMTLSSIILAMCNRRRYSRILQDFIDFDREVAG